MSIDHPTLLESLDAVKEQLAVLLMSGAGGAFVQAIFAPEKLWKRRVVQAFAGAVSAFFLGGVLGHLIDALTSAGIQSYSAGGFLMGFGGIAAVRSMQDKFLGEQK